MSLSRSDSGTSAWPRGGSPPLRARSTHSRKPADRGCGSIRQRDPAIRHDMAIDQLGQPPRQPFSPRLSTGPPIVWYPMSGPIHDRAILIENVLYDSMAESVRKPDQIFSKTAGPISGPSRPGSDGPAGRLRPPQILVESLRLSDIDLNHRLPDWIDPAEVQDLRSGPLGRPPRGDRHERRPIGPPAR